MRLTLRSRRRRAQLAAHAAHAKAQRDRIGACHTRLDALERKVAALKEKLEAQPEAKPLAVVQPRRVAAKTRTAARKPGKP